MWASPKRETARLSLEVGLGSSSSEVSEPFPLKLRGGQEPEGPHHLHNLNCSPQLPPLLASPLPKAGCSLHPCAYCSIGQVGWGKARME